MRFGIQVSAQEGISWPSWRRLFRSAEDLDFDSLWRSDHFFSFFGDKTRDSLETWVSLAVAAVETRRVRLGTLVCAVTFRHPALLARMAAQVDVLSGGRLELGLGAGHYPAEYHAFGIPFPPTLVRMEMLEESCQVLRALWGPGPATFQGRHYSLVGAECYPKPAQSPLPLLIGGRGERRTLKIVAKYADHWNVNGVDREGFVRKREVLDRHCADAGRDPKAIRSSLMTGLITGRDETEVRRHVLRAGGASFAPSRDPAVAAGELRARGWLIGSPDRVLSELRALEESGLQELIILRPDWDNWELLELVAREVLPHAKGRRDRA